MYRILIAEDNPTICRGIACCIDTEHQPVAVCAMAHNGEEAMQKFAEFQPDILVTDIRMPRCSGLELAEWISERKPETQIIILSSYDDFAYMRKAIHIHCVDYLLKPMNPKDLNAAISRAISALEAQSSEGRAEMSDIVMTLSALCYGTTQPLQVIPSIIQNKACCVVSTLHTDAPYIHDTSAAKIGKVYRLPGDILDDYIFLSDIDQQNSFLGAIHTFFLSQDNLPVAGISTICAAPSELCTARRAAQDALFYGFLFAPKNSGRRLFSFSELPPLVLPRDLSNLNIEFRYCLTTFDTNRISSLVHQTLTTAIHVSPSFQVIQTVFRHFLLLASSLLPEQFHEDEIHMMTTRQWFIKCGSIQNAEDQLIKTLCNKCQALSGHDRISAVQISEISAFIEHNINLPLSLDMLAEKFHLSPNYLATQYRNATGYTIGQKITHTRVEKAKQMLAFSTLPMHYIAEAVGYQSTEYFFRVFKKQVGVTPGQYRKDTTKEGPL